MLDWSSLKIVNLKDNNFLECTCNLYNISNALDENIKRSIDGPKCIDLIDGTSKSIYHLEENLCTNEVRIT